MNIDKFGRTSHSSLSKKSGAFITLSSGGSISSNTKALGQKMIIEDAGMSVNVSGMRIKNVHTDDTNSDDLDCPNIRYMRTYIQSHLPLIKDVDAGVYNLEAGGRLRNIIADGYSFDQDAVNVGYMEKYVAQEIQSMVQTLNEDFVTHLNTKIDNLINLKINAALAPSTIITSIQRPPQAGGGSGGGAMVSISMPPHLVSDVAADRTLV